MSWDEYQNRSGFGGDHRTTDGNSTLNSIRETRDTTYHDIQLDSNVQAQFGDQYHHGVTINATNVNMYDPTIERHSGSDQVSATPQKTFGLCLGNAPQLEQNAFIGRSTELHQLQELFPVDSRVQQVVSIVGMGGLGKTQLSLAYARECSMRYTSVFWVSAKDESSLRHGFCLMADIIMGDAANLAPNTRDEQSRVDNIRRWLSHEWNYQWLVIFDNYDDPDLPNIRSKSGFNIRSYFPHRAQGHILITTRTPKLNFSKRLVLRRFDDIEYSLAVLAQRAGRDLTTDSSARTLADRLDGLPLALATAGVYLSQTNISCMEYLQLYQSAWMELHGPDTEELFEYEDRTLSSTWAISFDQVCKVDADAAELLKFWAYFSNKDIWYDLIRAGRDQGPAWMSRITASKLRFDRAMARLQDYSLVEVTLGSYDIHPCVHTWVFAYFDTDRTAFLASLNCIMRSIPLVFSRQYWDITHRLLQHIDRLNDECFRDLWDEFASDQHALDYMNDSAALLYLWDRFDQAENMYLRALTGYQQTFGSEHSSTVCAMVNLGLLSSHQGQWDKAHMLYLDALADYERMPDPDPQLGIDICHNLGLSYRDQGKFMQAEEMLTRALTDTDRAAAKKDDRSSCTVADDGRPILFATALIDTALGHEHPSRLRILNHLGLIYWDQGKLIEAENALLQALAGSEKALGVTHPSTLHVVNNLGSLYLCLGLADRSEQMLLRALAGREAILGLDHTLTLYTVDSLGVLYLNQNDYDKAEKQFARIRSAFQGRPINIRLWGTVSNLTKCLSKAMKTGSISQHDARYRLAHLLPSLQTIRYEDSFNDKYHTARVLLGIGDEENALIAFVHATAVVCDGCDEPISPAQGGYHVCRQCVGVDLCNLCKVKYDDKTLILPECEGHEYFDLDAAISSFPDRARKLDPTGMNAWMERLRDQYPVTDDT